MRYTAVLVTILMMVFLVTVSSDELDSALVKELLKERYFETGLSASGSSGLYLTPSTECLDSGNFLIGLRGFLQRSDDPTREDSVFDFGFNVSGALGIWDDVFGLGFFKNVEISASTNLYVEDVSEKTRWGLGDSYFNVKTELVQYNPMRSDIPAISMIGSIVLPTGFEEFGKIDTVGLEFGFIFGAKVPDSSGTVKFDMYLDIRYAAYDYIDTGLDNFIKTSFGLSFPIADMPDSFFYIEFARISSNDSGDGGSSYSLTIRNKSDSRNISVGFESQTFSDIKQTERRYFVTYAMKF